jgi:hypothetical protein
MMVEVEHRVSGKDGPPVAGLHAAGSTGQAGLLLEGHGPQSAGASVDA